MNQRDNCRRTENDEGESGLPGMDLFDVDGSGYLELERDDEADRYADDDAAWDEFIAVLTMGDTATRDERAAAREMAVSLLNNWREAMHFVARKRTPPFPGGAS